MTFPTQSGGAGGGTDFQKKTPAYLSVSTATSLTTVLSINGRGIITSMSAFWLAAGSNIRVRLTIDGIQVLDDSNFLVPVTNTPHASITLLYGFKRSLLVEATSSASQQLKIAYLLG